MSKAINQISLATLCKGQYVTREQIEALRVECENCKPRATVREGERYFSFICIDPKTYIEFNITIELGADGKYTVTRQRNSDRTDLRIDDESFAKYQNTGKGTEKLTTYNLDRPNYENISSARRKVFDHYARSARVSAMHIEMLQQEVFDALRNLEPVLMDTDFDQNTKRQYDLTKKTLEKLLQRFEEKYNAHTLLETPLGEIKAVDIFKAIGQIRRSTLDMFRVASNLAQGDRELADALESSFGGANGLLDCVRKIQSMARLDFSIFANKNENSVEGTVERFSDVLNSDRIFPEDQTDRNIKQGMRYMPIPLKKKLYIPKSKSHTRLELRSRKGKDDYEFFEQEYDYGKLIDEATEVQAEGRKYRIPLIKSTMAVIGTYLSNIETMLLDCDMSSEQYKKFMAAKAKLEQEVNFQEQLTDNEKDAQNLFNVLSDCQAIVSKIERNNKELGMLFKRDNVMVDYLSSAYDSYNEIERLPRKYWDEMKSEEREQKRYESRRNGDWDYSFDEDDYDEQGQRIGWEDKLKKENAEFADYIKNRGHFRSGKIGGENPKNIDT